MPAPSRPVAGPPDEPVPSRAPDDDWLLDAFEAMGGDEPGIV